MIDKTTFGSTPAALYLATRINELDNIKLQRKVSATLQHYRSIINDLLIAHESKSISTQTLNHVFNAVNESVDKTTVEMQTRYDTLTITLMANVLHGEIKNVLNRGKNLCYFERAFSSDSIECIPALSDIIDPKTSTVLKQKSAKRLARLGKMNTLY